MQEKSEPESLPILSQNSSKREQVKENLAHKILAGIDNPFYWVVAATVTAAMQIAGVVSMKTALYILIILGLVIIVRSSIKEWLFSKDSHRVFAIIFLSTILSGGVVGLLYALMVYFKPVEFHFANLVPANELTPDNRCGELSPNSIRVLFGGGVAGNTDNDNTMKLISAFGEPLLTAKKLDNRIQISIELFNSESTSIAKIKDSVFVGERSENLDITSRDPHGLDIFDKTTRKLIFHIRYLNPQAIQILGEFYTNRTFA